MLAKRLGQPGFCAARPCLQLVAVDGKLLPEAVARERLLPVEGNTDDLCEGAVRFRRREAESKEDAETWLGVLQRVKSRSPIT